MFESNFREESLSTKETYPGDINLNLGNGLQILPQYIILINNATFLYPHEDDCYSRHLGCEY